MRNGSQTDGCLLVAEMRLTRLDFCLFFFVSFNWRFPPTDKRLLSLFFFFFLKQKKNTQKLEASAMTFPSTLRGTNTQEPTKKRGGEKKVKELMIAIKGQKSSSSSSFKIFVVVSPPTQHRDDVP